MAEPDIYAETAFHVDVTLRASALFRQRTGFYWATALMLECFEEAFRAAIAERNPITMQTTTKGLDVYHGDDDPNLFHAAAAAGDQYAFLKATEGLALTDVDYAGYRQRAKDVGLLVGAYHFFRPDLDPNEQAQHFISVAQPATGDLIPALDVEIYGPNVGPLALACATEIKALTGHCPIIYSSDSFFRSYLAPSFKDYTLWIARYGAAPMTPCAFWQNADNCHLSNVPHDLDADTFYGALADLQRYVI